MKLKTRQDQRMIGREAIASTYDLIRAHIRRTPVIEVAPDDLGVKARQLVFKLEQLQCTGSFKARGAFASLMLNKLPKAGVAAASGGNHGVAVAYAAKMLGVQAHIFVPEIASAAKIERIRALGAELVVAGERYSESFERCEAYVAKTGARSIHAYDQPETLLGQGTVGLEWETQSALDTILVAVGGGGLIGGMAAWYDGRVKIVAVEPQDAPTLNMAIKAGKPVDAPAGSVAADSLAPRQVGKLMFPFAQTYIDHVALVSDAAILNAQAALWRELRMVVEPGGATAFAALHSGVYKPEPGERVGVLLCGANATVVDFGRS